VLNAAAVYEDVCEYLMVLADLRLTLCTMVGSAIHDVLVAGASPREAIEKCVGSQHASWRDAQGPTTSVEGTHRVG